MKIINRQNTDYIWEFELVIDTGERDAEGEPIYKHIGYFEDYPDEVVDKFISAGEQNKILTLHNVRVVHKQLKRMEMK